MFWNISNRFSLVFSYFLRNNYEICLELEIIGLLEEGYFMNPQNFMFSSIVKHHLKSLNKFKSYLKFILKPFALILFIGLVSLSLNAQSEDQRRLQNDITSLKAKIRSSNTKDPKDIQRLGRLENELQKQRFLNKNRAQ